MRKFDNNGLLVQAKGDGMHKSLFTPESVNEGYPDKVCNQISDAIFDAILEKDPYS